MGDLDDGYEDVLVRDDETRLVDWVISLDYWYRLFSELLWV